VVTPLVVGPVEKLIAAARARGEGQLQARVGPVRGLRDMRELAAAYDRMSDVVDEQDQMRRNLVAYMAHELRTPIAVMQASTEAMMDHVVNVTGEQVESLHAEAVKLSGLVDSMQRMAVTAAAFAELKFRNDDLAAIASEAADGLQSVFRGAGVDMIRRLESAPARCDHDRMREVVTNLLSNAAKFTPASGQVVLQTRASKDAATLHVIDTGPGIPQEDLPLVAKRFYRSPTTSSITGSGLGLAIADELVRAHGGTMTISSQLGKGTTATIEIPRPDNGSPVGSLRPARPRRCSRLPAAAAHPVLSCLCKLARAPALCARLSDDGLS
jgi:two-component system sensor histidine kinase BaeS